MTGYEIPFDDLLGFKDVLVKLPAWWFTALLAWGAMLGLILFLFGRRLVKPAWGFVGFFIAGATGVYLSNVTGLPINPFVLGVLAGAIGAVIASFFLWRLLLAVSAGMVAFVLGCVAVIWAFGLPGPPIVEPIKQTVAELRSLVKSPVGPTAQVADERPIEAEPVDDLPPVRIAGAEAEPEIGDESIEADTEPDPVYISTSEIGVSEVASASEAISRGWDRLKSGWGAWWSGGVINPDSGEPGGGADGETGATIEVHERTKVIGFGLGTAFLVFLLALATPSTVSAPVTATVGGGMMLALVYHLGANYFSGLYGYLPRLGGSFIVMLGAIAVIGACLQWTVLRPKTDK